MDIPTTRTGRLNFRLSADLKGEIEEAAAALGQSVSDFAVAALVRTAREVNRERTATKLTDRDRDQFLKLLDDESLKPNKALKSAAKNYRKIIGHRK